MTNTLFGQSGICISKYKYSASLIISLLTTIVLTLTTMSYINITLFSILILCVSLFYLSRNDVIEGGEFDSIITTSNLNVNNILNGIGTVLTNNGIDVSDMLTQEYIAEATSIVSSLTTHGVNNSSTSSINDNGPYIDTTHRTKNEKVFDAYSKINFN